MYYTLILKHIGCVALKFTGPTQATADIIRSVLLGGTAIGQLARKQSALSERDKRQSQEQCAISPAKLVDQATTKALMSPTNQH